MKILSITIETVLTLFFQFYNSNILYYFIFYFTRGDHIIYEAEVYKITCFFFYSSVKLIHYCPRNRNTLGYKYIQVLLGIEPRLHDSKS